MRRFIVPSIALMLSACAAQPAKPPALSYAEPLPATNWLRCDIVFHNHSANMSAPAYAQLLNVPVADTAAKQQRGLSGRLTFGTPVMLFNWPDARRRPFWMNGTTVPLSVAFIDSNGYVTQIDAMQPNTNMFHWSDKPAQAALEAAPAVFTEYGIAVGSRLQAQQCSGPITFGPLRPSN
ncbi:MAG: DUF192 domain-containing protein [Acidiphilium sp.]|nr:DUF192 domain-containing protein [Acidiphilium sp.]